MHLSICTIRRLAWPALFASSLAAGAWAQSPSPGNLPVAPATSPASPAPPTPPKPGERLREGTKLIDVVGTFRFTGDQVAFSPAAGGDSVRVLENLALERIARLLGEIRGVPTWVVSGQITEYRGANFLLVTKAVMRQETSGIPAP
ncbi:MAG: hypothetical protein SFU86_11365 [Pirellulaceae bacterium]|nr:hypothetical protein [Pirellulaceae bacterium]